MRRTDLEAARIVGSLPPHVNVWGSVHDLGRPPAIDMADPA